MNLVHVSRYFRDPTVPRWRKWAGLLSVLYVLSPIDLIPDVLPIIGWLDDLGVVGLAVAFVTRDITRFAQRRSNVIDVTPGTKK